MLLRTVSQELGFMECRSLLQSEYLRLHCQSSRTSASKQEKIKDDRSEIINRKLTEIQTIEKNQRFEALRDISGLDENLKLKIRGHAPSLESENLTKVKHHRYLYGKFGRQSGVDPRFCWDTRSMATELLADELEWEPSLEQKLADLNSQQELEQSFMHEREEKIYSRMNKMSQLINEYYQRKRQRKDEEIEFENRKRDIVEEIRDYYGYYVDPSDEKFKEVLEIKAAEEKAEKKKKKKEKKQELMKLQIQALAAAKK